MKQPMGTDRGIAMVLLALGSIVAMFLALHTARPKICLVGAAMAAAAAVIAIRREKVE